MCIYDAGFQFPRDGSFFPGGGVCVAHPFFSVLKKQGGCLFARGASPHNKSSGGIRLDSKYAKNVVSVNFIFAFPPSQSLSTSHYAEKSAISGHFYVGLSTICLYRYRIIFKCLIDVDIISNIVSRLSNVFGGYRDETLKLSISITTI